MNDSITHTPIDADCHETVDAQLEYLRAAGFENVEIIWSEDLWCVFGGRKPNHIPDAELSVDDRQPAEAEG